MLLVIDNYDSFTYNLVQYLGELGVELRVIRNDEMTVDEIELNADNQRVAVLIGDDGSQMVMPLALLPAETQAVDVLNLSLAHDSDETERVQCPNCCRLARVTSRSMGLLFYRCDLCEAVGAVPAPPGFG